MAKAVIHLPAPVQPPAVVRLELSVAQAKTLQVLLDYVGGDPGKSARKYVEEIDNALTDAGLHRVAWPGGSFPAVTRSGAEIWLEDIPPVRTD